MTFCPCVVLGHFVIWLLPADSVLVEAIDVNGFGSKSRAYRVSVGLSGLVLVTSIPALAATITTGITRHGLPNGNERISHGCERARLFHHL